jgi:hypothetical protein
MGFLEIQLLDARELSYVGKTDTGKIENYDTIFIFIQKEELIPIVNLKSYLNNNMNHQSLLQNKASYTRSKVQE